MKDYLITETMTTKKDDETGELSYHVVLEAKEKGGDDTVVMKAEAAGDDKKAVRIAGRSAFIHALEDFWKIAKT